MIESVLSWPSRVAHLPDGGKIPIMVQTCVKWRRKRRVSQRFCTEMHRHFLKMSWNNIHNLNFNIFRRLPHSRRADWTVAGRVRAEVHQGRTRRGNRSAAGDLSNFNIKLDTQFPISKFKKNIFRFKFKYFSLWIFISRVFPNARLKKY